MSRTLPRSALILSLLATACTEATVPAPVAPRVALRAPAPPAATLPTETPAVEAAADFREGPTVRDPFRTTLPTLPPPTAIERDTNSPLGDASMDDLRLLAVVDSADGPVAMVADATGWGVTIRRGARVGRPELVRVDDVDYVARWRVARITPSHLRRGGDGRLIEAAATVVFEQDDPTGRALPRERSLTLAPAERAAMRGTFRLASARD